MSKKWYESKTLLANFILFIIAVAGLLTQQPFIQEQYIPYLLFTVAMLNLILRYFFTDKPIEK